VGVFLFLVFGVQETEAPSFSFLGNHDEIRTSFAGAVIVKPFDISRILET